MTRSFDLLDPERVTFGAVGEPGKRVFYMQARGGGDLVTLKMEKGQVANLAEFLRVRLAELPQPDDLPKDLDLEEPVDALWAVGPIGIGYDDDADRIVVEATERIVEDTGDEPGVVRLRLTRGQAAALVTRGIELVLSGRPPCELCGFPIDPSGHVCPRGNGQSPPPP